MGVDGAWVRVYYIVSECGVGSEVRSGRAVVVINIRNIHEFN